MEKTEKILQENNLQSLYDQLNEKQKEIIRNDFLEMFDHKSKDTFYKKLRGESPVYTLERKFFANRFNKPEADLFPEQNG